MSGPSERAVQAERLAAMRKTVGLDPDRPYPVTADDGTEHVPAALLSLDGDAAGHTWVCRSCSDADEYAAIVWPCGPVREHEATPPEVRALRAELADSRGDREELTGRLAEARRRLAEVEQERDEAERLRSAAADGAAITARRWRERLGRAWAERDEARASLAGVERERGETTDLLNRAVDAVVEAQRERDEWRQQLDADERELDEARRERDLLDKHADAAQRAWAKAEVRVTELHAALGEAVTAMSGSGTAWPGERARWRAVLDGQEASGDA